MSLLSCPSTKGKTLSMRALASDAMSHSPRRRTQTSIRAAVAMIAPWNIC